MSNQLTDAKIYYEAKEFIKKAIEENNYEDLFWQGMIIRMVLFTNIHEMRKYNRRT